MHVLSLKVKKLTEERTEKMSFCGRRYSTSGSSFQTLRNEFYIFDAWIWIAQNENCGMESLEALRLEAVV